MLPVMAAQDGNVPATFVTVELANIVWHIPQRYNQQLQYIGSGSYGSVVSAVDRSTGIQVAIKKVACRFSAAEEILTQRVYRELRLLRHMDHDNVLGLLDVYTPQNDAVNMQEVYFVTKFMDASLPSVSGLLQFDSGRVQWLMYQLLCGLKYIHSAGVIHRDLKPANIAVTRDWNLRILDFGLARQTQNIMTGYVSSLWYRAPEIMMSWQRYTQAVDMWSVGCIMGELLSGTALFPARTSKGHLDLILDLVGTPGEQFLQRIQDEGIQHYIRKQSPKAPKDFSEKFRHADPNAVDLLRQLLALDPEQRITAEQALAHPYLATHHHPRNETTAPPFSDAAEGWQLTADQWRYGIFQEIQSFRAGQQA